MQLNILNQVIPIQGTLTVVLADNRGSNAIGGFMESFSAHPPCRFCMGTTPEFQEKVTIFTFLHVKCISSLCTIIECF